MKILKQAILLHSTTLLTMLIMMAGCSKSSSGPSGNSGGGSVNVGTLDVSDPGQFTIGDTTYQGICQQSTHLIGLDSVSYVSIYNMDVQGSDTTYNIFVFENFTAAATGNFPLSYNYDSGIFQATDSIGTATNLHSTLVNNSGLFRYTLQSGTLTKTSDSSFTFKCTLLNSNTNKTYPVIGSGTY